MSEYDFEKIRDTLVKVAYMAGEHMKQHSGKTTFDDKANGTFYKFLFIYLIELN